MVRELSEAKVWKFVGVLLDISESLEFRVSIRLILISYWCA